MKKMNVLLIVGLMLFWILLSESFQVEQLVVGLVLSIVLSYWMGKLQSFADFSLCISWMNLGDYLHFIGILLWEIVKSNLQVAVIVLSPKMKIQPTFIRFKTKLQQPFLKTLLANGITLTPGTLTVEMKEDELLVHSLFRDNVQEVIHSKLEQILCRIEEKRS